MEGKFFGEFLMKKGILTGEELDNLLKKQSKLNKKIGEISLKRNYLDEKEVKTILDIQLTTDLSFGELAVEKGFLKEEDVYDLLFFQNIGNLHLGELLVRDDLISASQLSLLLKEYYVMEEKRRRLFFEYMEKHFPPELIMIIETLKKYFIRIRHGLLKPVGMDVEVVFLTSKEKFFYIETESKKYYIVVGYTNGDPDFSSYGLKRVLYNYLTRKNVFIKIKEIHPHEAPFFKGENISQGKKNLFFTSSTGDFVLIFY